ncbi:hypothetical protein [Mucilaginibacter rubeus]|uniref:Uncharacterized protein n=1 Tax=Mucilaginibacter rubeus TaxID=2027860 RepID=A0A5C1I1V2_9SPHI|nr:hypothetical protein [Mucilaginibacter rubeus]QEM12217.1 hypothetical protein DEO27_020060 [Mucilaginibacter rubeus]
MLNVIFVSDDKDADIGTNCALSHNHLTNEVDLQGNNVVLLNGDLCTSAEVEKTIGTFNGGKFILAAFSHGCEDALTSTADGSGYVHGGNSYYFGSSLVYTNCCYSGIKLKDSLIAEGCLGYVGYNDEVRLPRNPDDDVLFIACENSGLIHFLTTGDPLTASVEAMKTKYREQARSFLDQKMNVAAAFLLRNLNCLTFHESGTLTRDTLEN